MAVQALGKTSKVRNNPKPKEEELFDESAGYDDETGVQFAPGLTASERRQATILYRLFTPANEITGLWGICAVFGDPGTGKDTFGNYLSYTLKRYFPWKSVWRDERPRKLYGPYAGLFNEDVLSEELGKMKLMAKGVGVAMMDEILEKAADEWVSSQGKVMLKNSIIYLTEWWRYGYNREPHNPMNKTMGGIHKMKRHIDTLIIGTSQLSTELDKKTFLPWIDWRVTCTHSRVNPTGFTFFVEKVKYDRRMDMLSPIGRPFPIPVDAGKPRSFMGDGKIIVRRPDYQPITEEERIVLNVLNAGVTNYEELVAFLETEGDISEWEVLSTLKSLRFGKLAGKLKWVVDYPCYFGLFNSKSAPQMTTRVKVSD